MTVRITVDLEGTLYQDFSIQCVKNRITKSDVVRSLVGSWTYNSGGEGI